MDTPSWGATMNSNSMFGGYGGFKRDRRELPPWVKLHDPGEDLEGSEDSLKHRTNAPVLYLRNVLTLLRDEHPEIKRSGTWAQYETLVSRWEEFHDGPGPAVHEITDDVLQAFFSWVDGWNTATTWDRCYRQFLHLLKSCCPRSPMNKYGIPRGEPAPLIVDHLPVLDIPSPDWFRENRVPAEHRSGGHTPKRRSTLTLEDFQKVIDTCWTMHLDLMTPVWWETFFGWIWLTGMRCVQARLKLQWCMDGHSDGIDLASRTIVTWDSKKGHPIAVPIPDVLIPGLTILCNNPKTRRRRKRRVRKPGDKGYEAYVFRDTGIVSNTPFYLQWKAIWERALPVTTNADRELKHFLPHEMRSVSTTNWDLLPEPDCMAKWLVTGHKPPDVRTRDYFQPGDVRLREIVNRFSMPRLRAGERPEPQLRLFD